MLNAARTILFSCLLLAPIAAGAQQAPEAPQTPAQPAAGRADLPAVVARIGGEEISSQELLAQAQMMRGQAVRAGVTDPGQAMQFLVMVLDALISERLVLADSQTRGIAPTDAEIEEKLQAVVAAYGGEERFEQALAAQGLDRRYVRRQVTQTLSFDQMMDREIKPGIEVGEEPIAEFYERNKERFQVPALYKVRRILKRIPREAADEAWQAARSELEALRQQVLGGADFAALAQEHSDDQGTREQGGLVPWFPLPDTKDRFATLIAELEVGQVSEVAELEVGMFLLLLEDRRPERVKTLEEARTEIVNTLTAVEARKVIQERVERLRASADVEILM